MEVHEFFSEETLSESATTWRDQWWEFPPFSLASESCRRGVWEFDPANTLKRKKEDVIFCE